MYSIVKCTVIISLCSQIVFSVQQKHSRSSKLLFSEQEIVDSLVKKWSPLVWLAPNEKFLPGDVRTFLAHVHAEREKPSTKKIKDIGDNYSQYEELVYYDGSGSKSGTLVSSNRMRRNFEKDTSLEYIFELPIDDASENWFLVTNDELENLMKNTTSFIYGETPTAVPIYAVVSMCSNDKDFTFKNEIDSGNKWKKNPYIPLTKQPDIVEYNSMLILPNKPTVKEFNSSAPTGVVVNGDAAESEKIGLNEVEEEKSAYDKLSTTNYIRRKRRNEDSVQQKNLTDNETQMGSELLRNSNDNWKAIPASSVVIYTKDEQIVLPSAPPSLNLAQQREEVPMKESQSIPHFQVSYWMFYPFSQGKTICTLNLGPLGPIPIPLIWNMCLGTKKEFGSHVGDWEHFSLSFKGQVEPEEMYVSAHDAGAFYRYDRLTGTFEYKSQETRKGILQHPIFPKTVITSDNHPVLFAAEGSHGLWASPGKHRFVRVPRLYDVNGFGQPWQTWENVEIIYSDAKRKRSLSPNQPSWMKFRGRWGNPKSKCHPLRRIGLHVCEWTDGPRGIPTGKGIHFTC